MNTSCPGCYPVWCSIPRSRFTTTHPSRIRRPLGRVLSKNPSHSCSPSSNTDIPIEYMKCLMIFIAVHQRVTVSFRWRYDIASGVISRSHLRLGVFCHQKPHSSRASRKFATRYQDPLFHLWQRLHYWFLGRETSVREDCPCFQPEESSTRVARLVSLGVMFCVYLFDLTTIYECG